jgi:hypothetical protein
MKSIYFKYLALQKKANLQMAAANNISTGIFVSK